MIANAQCLLPTGLRRTVHVQLVWRHDNIFPTRRLRPECVSLSTNTVTIPIHPHVWLVKTYHRADTFDSDSFRRCRHQEHSYFRRKRHGRQRRDVGDRSRPQDRLGTKRSRAERIVVCCMELFCATIQKRLYHWPRHRASPRTCVNFSLGHKDSIAST